jgi:hypothetical protein
MNPVTRVLTHFMYCNRVSVQGFYADGKGVVLIISSADGVKKSAKLDLSDTAVKKSPKMDLKDAKVSTHIVHLCETVTDL